MIGPVPTHGLNGTGSSVSGHASACKSAQETWRGRSTSTALQAEAELDRTGTCFLDTSFVRQARLVFFDPRELPDQILSRWTPDLQSVSQASLAVSHLWFIVVVVAGYRSILDALWPWNSPLLTGRRANPSSLPPSFKAARRPHQLRCFRAARHLARTPSLFPPPGLAQLPHWPLRVRDPPSTNHFPEVYAIASWTSSNSAQWTRSRCPLPGGSMPWGSA